MPAARQPVDIVVKLGGGVLRHPEDLRAVLECIRRAAQRRGLLVVPGGGPFADAVRRADRTLQLGDEAAHWMAVLAMDQCAHLVVSRLQNSRLVFGLPEIVEASLAGSIPVLAPFNWLWTADPLPHSWDVTSDSIAAWVAGAIGARALVLVKPPLAGGPALVDAYFERARPALVEVDVIAADRVDDLGRILEGST